MKLLLVLAAMTAGSPEQLSVYVGHTIEVNVGYKIGFACDNTEILDASMVTRGGTNFFVVAGIEPGATWCKVGTSPGVPNYLFEVIVEEKPPS